VGRRLLFASALLAIPTLLAAAPAHAMGAIVTAPPGSSSITAVRIAVASTPTRTTRWVSLDVHGGATAFAWIVPVKPTGFVDLASDAWLESLEEATAPRVVPPVAPAACPVNDEVDVEGQLNPVTTVQCSSVVVAADGPTLATELQAWGLTMSSALAADVAAAGANGDSFVALYYPQTSVDVLTHTLRVVDASPSTFPLDWLPEGGPIDVLAYTVLAGGLTLQPGAPLLVDPSTVLWDQGGSTYGSVTSATLLSNPGAWLLDTLAQEPVFQPVPLPGGTIGSLTSTYFDRASAYGDATGEPHTCTAAATAWATSAALVAVACPTGSVARVGAGTCVETTATGEIAPDAFRCGGISDDLALALSGLAPVSAWISRMRSVVSVGGDTGVAPGEAVDGGPRAVGPVVTSSGYASDVCPPGGTGAESDGGTNPGTGSSGGQSWDKDAGGTLGPGAEDDAAEAAGNSSGGCDPGACQGVSIIEFSVAGPRRPKTPWVVALLVAGLAVVRRGRRRVGRR